MVNLKNRCTQSESCNYDKNDFVTQRYRGHLWRVLSSGLNMKTRHSASVYIHELDADTRRRLAMYGIAKHN